MGIAEPNQNMTAEDYKATYVNLCNMGAGVTGVLVVITFFASILGWTIDSIWLLIVPGILITNNAIELDPEAVDRIGKKKLLGFYLVAGQFLCVFPISFISSIFTSSVSESFFFLNSGMGVLVAFLALFGIKLKERFGNLRIGFIKDE